MVLVKTVTLYMYYIYHAYYHNVISICVCSIFVQYFRKATLLYLVLDPDIQSNGQGEHHKEHRQAHEAELVHHLPSKKCLIVERNNRKVCAYVFSCLWFGDYGLWSGLWNESGSKVTFDSVKNLIFPIECVQGFNLYKLYLIILSEM